MSAGHTRPPPGPTPPTRLPNEGLYIQYIICYIPRCRYQGVGEYIELNMYNMSGDLCVCFFYFAVWSAKLMQKQMVSNMHKKKGKCDKPEGDAWLEGGAECLWYWPVGKWVQFGLPQEVQQLQQRLQLQLQPIQLKVCHLSLRGVGTARWCVQGERGCRGVEKECANYAELPEKQVSWTRGNKCSLT